MINSKQQFIYVTFQEEGIHRYPAAAQDPKLKTGEWNDVSFLGAEHRHIFHFRVELEVMHDDRDVEFIQFKRELQNLYRGNMLTLDHKSCEMISDELAKYINNTYPEREIRIQVAEDGENGSWTVYTPSKPPVDFGQLLVAAFKNYPNE